MVRDSGSPVLIDFGGVCDGCRPPNEGGSTVIGTHGYAPAEQYLGQASPASDLYALGASLLHLVGGHSPAEYDFSAGCIEVPDSLPCLPQLRHLISRCLKPALRDRPESAAVARTIFLNFGRSSGAKPKDGNSPRVAAPTDPGQATTKVPVYDPGPVPREVTPENRGFYEALIPPVAKGRAGWLMWMGLSVLSLGVLPIISLATHYNRKRRYEALFRNGLATTGPVLNVTGPGQNSYRQLIYEFTVDGQDFRGLTPFYDADVQIYSTGDSILVLYDKADPNVSCATYPSKSSAFMAMNTTSKRILFKPRMGQKLLEHTESGLVERSDLQPTKTTDQGKTQDQSRIVAPLEEEA